MSSQSDIPALSFSLRAKFGLSMAIVVVFAIIVAGLLVFQQFTRALHEAAQTRIGFIASQLRDAVEAGMNLGFDLAALRQAQGWPVRDRHPPPEIHSILKNGRASRRERVCQSVYTSVVAV